MDKEKALRIYQEVFGSFLQENHASALHTERDEQIFRFAEAVETETTNDLAEAFKRWQAPFEAGLSVIDTMQRTAAAVVAWRDKYQVTKGSEVIVAQLVELSKSVLDVVGWFAPATPLKTEDAARPLVAEMPDAV